MLTTDQPSSGYVDYSDGMFRPMGPHPATVTDWSPGLVRDVSGVQRHYLSDGWTAPVTSSRPAVVTGQRTATVTCPPYVGTPAGTYIVHSDGDRAGSVHEPVQSYRSSMGQRSTTSDRGSDHPPGEARHRRGHLLQPIASHQPASPTRLQRQRLQPMRPRHAISLTSE